MFILLYHSLGGSAIHSFIHSFDQDLLGAYYMPATILDARYIGDHDRKGPCSDGSPFLVKEADNKHAKK